MKNKMLFKICFSAIMTAFASLAFMLESLFPPLFLPGARLGLSNVFILLVSMVIGWKYGFAVLTIKTFIGSLFAGNLSTVMYSLPAGLISLTVQFLLFSLLKNVSIVSTSVAGAVINSLVQNVVFCLVTGTSEFLVYLPYLSLISTFSGIVIGIIVSLALVRFPQKYVFTNINKN